MNEITLDIGSKQNMSLAVESRSGLSLEIGKSTGVSNYEALVNKPSIEGVVLIKDKTFKQLGLEAMTPQDIDDMLFGLE